MRKIMNIVNLVMPWPQCLKVSSPNHSYEYLKQDKHLITMRKIIIRMMMMMRMRTRKRRRRMIEVLDLVTPCPQCLKLVSPFI